MLHHFLSLSPRHALPVPVVCGEGIFARSKAVVPPERSHPALQLRRYPYAKSINCFYEHYYDN